MVNKKQLYEQIMSCVAEEVKKYINENVRDINFQDGYDKMHDLLKEIENRNYPCSKILEWILNKLDYDVAIEYLEELNDKLREYKSL